MSRQEKESDVTGVLPRIVVIGRAFQSGAYLLRIHLGEDEHLCFGRFKKGKSVLLPAGEYAYTGSAMGKSGSSSLASRLFRHTMRTGEKKPHRIQQELVEILAEVGLGSGRRSRREKKKHWHIDYLLDLEAAEIEQVFVVRSGRSLEGAFARSLEEDPNAQVIERGLGASDAAGRTHLLRISAGEEWWVGLADRLKTISEQAGWTSPPVRLTAVRPVPLRDR